jgi:hypothetical protein
LGEELKAKVVPATAGCVLEYEEIPELTEAFFAQADCRVGGKLIQRGRPKSKQWKVLLTIHSGYPLKNQP